MKEVFLDSDTDVAVVSALWGGRNSNPTPIEYAAEARALVEAAGGRHRALIHGVDVPAVQTATRNDAIARLRRDYAGRSNPSFQTFGPKTRREFVAGFRF